jgi:hypothetical protein
MLPGSLYCSDCEVPVRMYSLHAGSWYADCGCACEDDEDDLPPVEWTPREPKCHQPNEPSGT